MKTIIVHLSDIHLKKETEQNYVLSRATKIANSILGKARDIKNGFLVISGDIAFSGQVEEYNLAYQLLDDICLILKRNNWNIYVVVVPGNHDCDFSGDQSIRKILIEKINEDSSRNNAIVTHCLSAQNNFQHFKEKVMSAQKDIKKAVDTLLFESVYFEIEGKCVLFNLLNTAWMSQINEKQGLYYPVDELCLYSKEDLRIDLSISVFHHPYTWFEPDNSKAIQKSIEAMSDIVLTGHDHINDYYKKTKLTGNEIEYLEGGVLQDKLPINSEFNILVVDLDKRILDICEFTWDDKTYFYRCDNSKDSLPFMRNPKRHQLGVEINPSFELELRDIGISFSHPNVDIISLEDIFIYPDLRKLFTHNDHDLPRSIIREEITQFIIENKKTLIVGSDKSGKTILAKKLFTNLNELGLITILINGEIIKEYDDNHVETYLKQALENIYAQQDYHFFLQLERSKKALIIDDFQRSPLKVANREKVINILCNYFEYIIIIGNEQLRFTDILLDDESNVLCSEFVECEILGFGHVKRTELIEKWFVLGNKESAARGTDLSQNIIRAEKTITSLLGNGLIPPYPFYVLAILQQMEVGTPVSTKSGSYGYLYEALLTIALGKIVKKGTELDIIYNYLSRLAFHFYTNKITTIEEDKLREWHSDYCIKQKLTIDLDTLLMDLLNIGIITKDISGTKFKYPYIFYYFTGRYLSEHIHEIHVKSIIANMSERLNQTESANIIIFLCYLSKDPFILDTLLYTSNVLFDKHKEFDIDLDTKELSRLLSEIPQLILSSENPEQNHSYELKIKDELDEKSDESNEVNKDEEFDEKLDKDLEEFLQINVALKTIQINGQLLRNFPGSWDGDQKYELVRECYNLGLRILSFAYHTIEDNREGIAQKLDELLSHKYPKWDKQRIFQNIQNKIFGLMEGLTFVFIKHISDSVGHDRFAMTFNDLLNSNPNNTSYRYIDLSIHLDYYKEFPQSDVFSLLREMRKNNFATFVLRHLIWYYFYIYPTPYKLRQSICDKAGITLSPQLGKGKVQKSRILSSGK